MSSCRTGSGGTPYGRGAQPGIVGSLRNQGNLPTMYQESAPRYNYRDGRLYPDPPSSTFGRLASNNWPGKVIADQFTCASGFVGVLQPDNTIAQVWRGLPGTCTTLNPNCRAALANGAFAPMSSASFGRLPYKFFDGVPRACAGRRSVVRNRCDLMRFSNVPQAGPPCCYGRVPLKRGG